MRRSGRHLEALLIAAALGGCAATPPKAPAPPSATVPPASPHETDPSFDWQALVVAPFGSTLKAVPIKVHEALLFKDEARGAGAADDGECYAPDGIVPRFLGREPDDYLLCFRQDRLLRVRAVVRLEAGQAASVFAEACERWMKTVDGASAGTARSPSATSAAASPASKAAGATPPPAAAPSTAPPGAAPSCRGRSGKVRFDARLGADLEPGAPSGAQPGKSAVPGTPATTGTPAAAGATPGSAPSASSAAAPSRAPDTSSSSAGAYGGPEVEGVDERATLFMVLDGTPD